VLLTDVYILHNRQATVKRLVEIKGMWYNIVAIYKFSIFNQ